MSRYGGWPRYVPVAERRRRAAQEMAKLSKKGVPISPVVVTGRIIANTFWGKAWCDTMEGYRDYENRLPRGRTYVRNGSVLDLQIAETRVDARVSGSSIYSVTITIRALPAVRWGALRRDCAGGIESLVDLLHGRLSKAVMERICDPSDGLFPKSSEIKFSCTCPDSASMCKHVAATLYGIGARLDYEPELLFRLRAVDNKELITGIGKIMPQTDAMADPAKVLESDDVAALFGLDMVPLPSKNIAPVPDAASKKSVAQPKLERKRISAKREYEFTEDGYLKWWKD